MGFESRNWRDDFQLTLHPETMCGSSHESVIYFLTNIHRLRVRLPTHPLEDHDLRGITSLHSVPNLSAKPLIRRRILAKLFGRSRNLAVFNDEAHHIHDPKMAWFKSIQTSTTVVQKDRRLALQIDVTATPRHNNGAIFVHTVSDYPGRSNSSKRGEASHSTGCRKPRQADGTNGALFTEK